ncbi:cytochrome P450 [Glonium stellatum]|uniref:Cytochrome P450 n=1 Tax=Glonium stellatum TaxID=574774 RepID=A0A8E2ERX7_9PEZI|nr:cytochrome P450 [Glonium stellatum]
MGNKHYIVLMPSLVKQFFVQRPSVLSSDSFLHWIHDKYFGDGGASKRIPEHNFHKVHSTFNPLMREPFLSTATARMRSLVEEQVIGLIHLPSDTGKRGLWERFANFALVGEKSAEADLFPLVMSFVASIAGVPIMGLAYVENNHRVVEDLWAFDNAFGALLAGLPGLTPKLVKARAARTRLLAATKEWNEAVAAVLEGKDPGPKWKDLSDVPEMMRLRVKTLRDTNSEEIFASVSNLAVYWALMVNSNKVTFWMLLHIVSDSELLENIKKEITPYARRGAANKQSRLALDVDGLVQNCPLLKATFFEILRLYTAGTSYKRVQQGMILTESPEDAESLGKPKPQTYHVKAGTFLVIPHATMQMDPRLWSNPDIFNPSRFLVPDNENGMKMRADPRHLNAFGGGQSMCKGRLFAEREVLIFISGILTAWEFKPAGGKTKIEIPKTYYNSTGSASPKSVIRVQVSRRAS